MALKKKEEVIVTPKVEVASVNNDEMLLLETRKVKALEKIANSNDALTMWFEEMIKMIGVVECNTIYPNFTN